MKFYEEYAEKEKNSSVFYYRENIKKSSELYPYICVFEVLIRNKIAKHLSTYFPDWYKENSNFNQSILQSRHSKFISHANSRLLKRGKIVNEDGVISELTLGFWVTLFKKTYSQDVWHIWKYKNLFVGSWAYKKIGFIHNELEKIRYIRNRISHYEQILTYHPKEIKNNLLKIIKSLDAKNKIENYLDIFT